MEESSGLGPGVWGCGGDSSVGENACLASLTTEASECGAGEVVHWLRTLGVLVEDQNLILTLG